MKKILALILMFAKLTGGSIAWDSPETISSSGVDSSNPSVAIDMIGNIVAIWLENDYVMSSWHPVGGSWSSPTTLSNSGASSPHLVVDPNGNATVIWLEGTTLLSTSASFNGTWAAPITLSTSASSPDLAVDATGNLAAVWISSGTIQAKTQAFGESWSAVATTLSQGSSDCPRVAIGDGTACAVWHSIVSGTDVIWSSSLNLGSSWGAQKSVAAGAYSHGYPSVAVDPFGNASVIWFRYFKEGNNYTTVNAITSTLPKNASSWSVPIFLSQNGSRNPADLFAKIVFDNSGNALAIWNMSYNGATFNIEASEKIAGGSWSDPVEIVDADIYSYRGDVSANSLGNVVATYMVFDGSAATIQAAEVNITGILSSVYLTESIEVSTGSDSGYPRVASTYDGDTNTLYAAAAWVQADGMNVRIQASIGSRNPILPPINLTVTQNSENYGIFTDYSNTISWEASPSPDVTQYAIFRNGILVTRVDASQLEFTDHNMVENGAVSYSVTAVDSEFTQSKRAIINFP